jgi:hypothetical protein
MTIDGRLDRLTGIVESLAESVVEHTDQIEKLRRSQADANRHFEAYLKRLPPQ